MRALVQRVSGGSVSAGGRRLGRIGPGLVVLLGLARGDDEEKARWLAGKVARLRVFADGGGRMNRSVRDAGGGILLVSQFTLYADTSRGNRPGFEPAMPPSEAEPLFRRVVEIFREEASPAPVETGEFGAEMTVTIVNEGPVTLLLER
jgi:D-tyrosyl-tRNA(Tyr) deacylase